METTRITSDNLPLIQQRIQALRHFAFGDAYDPQNPHHAIVCSEQLQVGDTQLCIRWENTGKNTYSIADFLRYTEDLADITVVDHYIFAGTTVQVPINFPISGPIDLSFTSANYTLKVVFAPFLVNLIDAQMGNFTPREYYAVEIYNPYGIADYMESEVRKMVNRMLFHLSHNTQKNFHIHPLPLDKEMLWKKSSGESEVIKMETLPTSSLLLRMYRHALARSNNVLTRYINFYKMIEVVGPLALKDHLYHKLFDQLKNRSGQFTLSHLNGIIDSVYEYDRTIQEEVLASTVINNCVNSMKELYTELPDSVKRICAKDLNMKIETDLSNVYSTNLKVVYDKVGQVLYATRKSIAHVKSIHTLTGEECPEEDLQQMNVFLSKMCYSLILWNNRQPDHIRLRD